jgi:hypothetical protein
MVRALARAGLTFKKIFPRRRAQACGRRGQAPSVLRRGDLHPAAPADFPRRVRLQTGRRRRVTQGPPSGSETGQSRQEREHHRAIRLAGVVALHMSEGAINIAKFSATWSATCCPTHARGMFSSWITSAHTDRSVLETIESTGVKVLFLPPYSREFNPIENYWSTFKQVSGGSRRAHSTICTLLSSALPNAFAARRTVPCQR